MNQEQYDALLSEFPEIASLPKQPESEPSEVDDYLYGRTGRVPAAMRQGSSNLPEVAKGIVGGIYQTKGLLQGGAALLGDMVGIEGLRKWGMEGYKESMEDAAKYAPEVPDITRAKSAGEVFDWAMYYLPNSIATSLPAIGTGGVAGLVAKIGGKKFVEKSIKELTKKGISAKAAKELAQAQLGKRIAKAAGTGAFAGNYALSGGGIYGDTEDVSVTLPHAAVAAALDSFTPFSVLKRTGLMPKVSQKIAKNIPLGVAKEALTEAGTEGLQTLIEQHASHWVATDGDSLLTDLSQADWRDLVNSSLAGAGAGGAFSGVSSIQQGLQKQREKALETDMLMDQLDVTREKINEIQRHKTELERQDIDSSALNDTINHFQSEQDRIKGILVDRPGITLGPAVDLTSHDEALASVKQDRARYKEEQRFQDTAESYQPKLSPLAAANAAEQQVAEQGGDSLSQALAASNAYSQARSQPTEPHELESSHAGWLAGQQVAIVQAQLDDLYRQRETSKGAKLVIIDRDIRKLEEQLKQQQSPPEETQPGSLPEDMQSGGLPEETKEPIKTVPQLIAEHAEKREREKKWQALEEQRQLEEQISRLALHLAEVELHNDAESKRQADYDRAEIQRLQQELNQVPANPAMAEAMRKAQEEAAGEQHQEQVRQENRENYSLAERQRLAHQLIDDAVSMNAIGLLGEPVARAYADKGQIPPGLENLVSQGKAQELERGFEELESYRTPEEELADQVSRLEGHIDREQTVQNWQSAQADTGAIPQQQPTDLSASVPAVRKQRFNQAEEAHRHEARAEKSETGNVAGDSRLQHPAYRQWLSDLAEEISREKTKPPRNETLIQAIRRLGAIKTGSMEDSLAESLTFAIKNKEYSGFPGLYIKQHGLTLDDMATALHEDGFNINGREMTVNELSDAIANELSGRPMTASHEGLADSRGLPGYVDVSTAETIKAALAGKPLNEEQRHELLALLDEAEHDPHFEKPEHLTAVQEAIEQQRQEQAKSIDWYDHYEPGDYDYADSTTGLDSDTFTDTDWQAVEQELILQDAQTHEETITPEETHDNRQAGQSLRESTTEQQTEETRRGETASLEPTKQAGAVLRIETGLIKIKDGLSLTEIRKTAKDYAESHSIAGQKVKVINKETGYEIKIPLSGIKHTLSGALRSDLLNTIPYTKEILINAHLVETTDFTKGKPGVIETYYFEQPIEINGEEKNLIITVFKRQDGKYYYDHAIKKSKLPRMNAILGPHSHRHQKARPVKQVRKGDGAGTTKSTIENPTSLVKSQKKKSRVIQEGEIRTEPISETVHPKTGETMYGVKVIGILPKEKFSTAAKQTGQFGGTYAKGQFLLPSQNKAETFIEWLTGKEYVSEQAKEKKSISTSLKSSKETSTTTQAFQAEPPEKSPETARSKRKKRRRRKLIEIDDELSKAGDELAEVFRKEAGKLGSGLDPVVAAKVLQHGMKVGVLYVQKGAIKFADWADNMLAMMESKGIAERDVAPHLKSLYLAVSASESLDESVADQMDDRKAVRAFDVETLLEPEESYTPDEIQAVEEKAFDLIVNPENNDDYERLKNHLLNNPDNLTAQNVADDLAEEARLLLRKSGDLEGYKTLVKFGDVQDIAKRLMDYRKEYQANHPAEPELPKGLYLNKTDKTFNGKPYRRIADMNSVAPGVKNVAKLFVSLEPGDLFRDKFSDEWGIVKETRGGIVYLEEGSNSPDNKRPINIYVNKDDRKALAEEIRRFKQKQKSEAEPTTIPEKPTEPEQSTEANPLLEKGASGHIGQYRIEPLSDKSFIVTGTTPEEKTTWNSKGLGGKWRGKEKGWMFPESRREKIVSEIESMVQGEAGTTTETEKLAQAFYQHLSSGKPLTDNNAVKRFIAEREGIKTSEVTPEQMKHAQESLELALVMVSRDIVNEGVSDQETYQKLLAQYQSQPNLNTRSSTSMANQAYSTPAPLAFIAGKMAGIDQNTTVYEPTAGNGMLLINADINKSTVNELEDLRVSHLQELGYQPTQQDATVYIPTAKHDAMITNPPFGVMRDDDNSIKAVDVNGYGIKKLEHLIAARALEAIKDDGKASIIIGASKKAGEITPMDRVFFNWLYAHYNVTDHFEIDGDLYKRQGAGWPVRVITVNRRQQSDKFSPKSGTIERLTSWEEVYERYQSFMESSGQPSNRRSESSTVSEELPAGQLGETGTASPQPVPGSGRTGDRGGRAGAGKGSDTDTATGSAGIRTGRSHEHSHSDSEQRPGTDAIESSQLSPGTTAISGTTKGSTGRVSGAGSVKDTGNNRKSNVSKSDYQTPYNTASGGFNDSVLTPVNMAHNSERALQAIAKAVGNIDEYVMEKLGYDSREELYGAFMGLQIDTIAATIYNIETKNKGMIIADQTGVGKGRQAAGIIRYAHRTGRIPVFVTVKDNLFTDMFNDLADIGEHGIHPLILNQEGIIKQSDANGNELAPLYKNPSRPKHVKNLESILETGELPEGRNAIFMTYSQVNKSNLQRRVLDSIQTQALFILDESHNAAGPREKKEKKVKKITTAGFIYNLLENQPVVYLSATYAKRPDNTPLYYRTDLMDAVDNMDELITAVAAGGVPLQTVMANMLAESGQLFRRERSFEGIDVKTVVDYANGEAHRAIYDDVSTGLRAINDADIVFQGHFLPWAKENAEQMGESVRQAGNQPTNSIDHQNFTSIIHNYIRQLLMALKVDAIVEQAIDLHKQGIKPVIATDNTMGSFIADTVERNGLKVGDSYDYDYRDILQRALERARRISVKDKKGESHPVQIELKDLDGITRNAFIQAQKTIDSLDLGHLPVSPIDYIIHKLKAEGINIGEITGRDYTVDYSGDNPTLSKRDQKEAKDKRGTVDRFNNGQLDVVVLNQSGATGLSIHASEKFIDQKPRHMLVMQASQDINILMQMLGRINRTGQVTYPTYSFLNVDLPAEKRPAAILSQHMQSLNANTSANSESDTSIKAANLLNKYGSKVINDYMKENPDIAQELGLIISEKEPPLELARQFTGRLALMPVKVQAEVYATIEKYYNEYIDFLDKTDQNDLNPKTLDLDARIVSSDTLYEGKKPGTVFGGNTTLHQVDIKYQGKPPTPEDVGAALDGRLEGTTPEAIAQEILDTKASDNYFENSEKKRKQVEDQWQSEAKKDMEQGNIPKQDEPLSLETISQSLREHDDYGPKHKMTKKYQGFEERLDKLEQNLVSDKGTKEAATRMIGRTFTIGSHISLEIAGDTVTGVVTNIKDSHKQGKGNPYSLSKTKVTFMINNGIRQLDLPLSQLLPISEGGEIFKEKLRNSGKTGLDTIFEPFLGTGERRERRYIATGNLIAGFSKLSQNKGRIISFTDPDTNIHQGIFLPRNFNEKAAGVATIVGDIAFRNPDVLTQYLRNTKNYREVKSKIFSQKQVATVSHEGGQWVITIPVANTEKIARDIKFNKPLQDAMGTEFFSRGNKMTARFDDARLADVTSRLLDITPFYTYSGNRDLYEEAGGPPLGSATQSFSERETPVKAGVFDSGLEMAKPTVFSRNVDKSNKGMSVEQVTQVAREHLKSLNIDTDTVELYVGENEKTIYGGRDVPEFLGTIVGQEGHERPILVITADYHSSPQDVRETIDHEVIAHYGMAKFLTPKEKQKLLNRVKLTRKLLEPAWKYVERLYGDKSLDEQAEEVIAYIAENPQWNNKGWHRIVESILKALQKVGLFKNYVTKQEIESVLASLAESIHRKEPGNRFYNIGYGELKQHFGSGITTYAQRKQPLREINPPTVRRSPNYQSSESTPDNITQVINKIHGNAKPKSYPERAKQWLQERKPSWLGIKQGIIDSFASVEALETGENAGKLLDGARSAYKAFLRTKNLDGVMSAIFAKGTPQLQNGSVVIKENSRGLLDIFDDVARRGELEQWEVWAGAQRAKRIMAEDEQARQQGEADLAEAKKERDFLKSVAPESYDGGVKAWERDMKRVEKEIKTAKKLVNQKRERLYEATDIQALNDFINGDMDKKARFEQTQQAYRDFNKDMLDFAQDAGLINPESRSLWEHDDYIPFHRISPLREKEGQQGPHLRRAIHGQKANIKQLKGSVEQISPLEAIVQNTRAMVDASFKNIAMQRITDLAEPAGIMEVAASSKLTDDEVMHRLEELGIDYGLTTPDKLRQWRLLLDKFDTPGEGQVKVSVDGKSKTYYVNDPLLLSAMGSMGGATIETWLKVFRLPKKLLTNMVTATPGFMAANYIRDTLQTWLLINPKVGEDQKSVRVNMLKSMRKAIKNVHDNQAYWDMMMAGAGTGGYYDSAPAKIRGQLRKPSFKKSIVDSPQKAWTLWNKIGMQLEMANRTAVFDEVISKGGSVAEAAHQAQDLTNFSKAGSYKAVQMLIQMVPFLNARIQGLDRLVRGARDNPAQFFLRGMIYATAATALALYNLDNDDNDEYDNLLEWEKIMYHHFWLNGEHYRIPKPFELGSLFGTLPEIAVELAQKGDTAWAGRMVSGILTDALNMDLMPQLFKPVYSIATNTNSLTKAPVVGMGMQFVKPEAQYDPWTSESIKNLANALPDNAPETLRSPKKLQYLLQGYFGTIGATVLGMTDYAMRHFTDAPEQPSIRLQDLPIIGRFVRDGVNSSRYTREVYRMLKDANELSSTIKKYKEQGLYQQAQELATEERSKLSVRRNLNHYQQQISKLKKQQRRVLESRIIRPEGKRKQIDLLTQQINQLSREAVQRYGTYF